MCNMTLPAFVTWLYVEHYGDLEGVFPTTSFNQGYHNLCLIHFGHGLWGRKGHATQLCRSITKFWANALPQVRFSFDTDGNEQLSQA